MRFIAPLVLLLTLAASAPAVPGASDATDARLPLCDAPVDVPGQGLSCPVAGGWAVPLADGKVVFTHGPDPLPAAPEIALPTLSTAPTTLPAAHFVCVYDETQPHVRVLFTNASNVLGRWPALLPSVLAGLHTANGILRESALPFGWDVRFKVLCAPDGSIDIQQVILPTPNQQTSFGTIVSDTRAAGYDNPVAKYWIIHDGGVSCGCGGQGSGWGDDRPGPENWNNDGGLHAISYVRNYGLGKDVSFFLSQVILHESGHTMGAVQNSAPHTTGNFHCTDGADIMCYNDGGPNGRDYNVRACFRVAAFELATTWPWDCNNDDYFHPAPPAGSYLATRWNTGSANNHYLSRSPL